MTTPPAVVRQESQPSFEMTSAADRPTPLFSLSLSPFLSLALYLSPRSPPCFFMSVSRSAAPWPSGSPPAGESCTNSIIYNRPECVSVCGWWVDVYVGSAAHSSQGECTLVLGMFSKMSFSGNVFQENSESYSREEKNDRK